MNSITIADKQIGKAHKPFIIAEMSGNHNGDLDRALKIVEAAAKAGADAIKLQTYTADTMTLNLKEKEFLISDKNSLWYGRNLHDLYNEAHTPWDWHREIFQLAKELGIIAFSSPFDASAVDFLESLDAPCYKIASFEIVDIPLIKKVAKTGKPMIISTGMATKQEILEAVNAAKESGCQDLILLKCTSTYPASPLDTNISTIPDMEKSFASQIGLSDHTKGIGVAVASIALGATVIEKHFTLSRKDGGVDSAFSLEPNELDNLATETNRAWQSIGEISYGGSKSEQNSTIFRRSLYITKDIKAGDKITSENIRAIRPGLGLAPKFYNDLIGKIVNQDLKKGTPVSFEILEAS